MLRLSIEELSALNLVLSYVSVKELLEASNKGFASNDSILSDNEIADLCYKVVKTLG